MIHGAPDLPVARQLLPLVQLERMLGPSKSDATSATATRLTVPSDVNFGDLRDMHLRWKTRLERMLDGHEAPRLGTGRRPRPMRARVAGSIARVSSISLGASEFDHLVQVHADIHTAVKDVVDVHHSGKVAEAQAAMARVAKLSLEVVAAPRCASSVWSSRTTR